MMREWEVVNVRDVESALKEGPGSTITLIDLGTTQEGLSASVELYQQGVTIPCVVLGDVPASDEAVPVLVRPFSLDDLASAMQNASTQPSVASRHSGHAAETTATTANGAATVGVKKPTTTAAPKPRSEPSRPPEPPVSKPQKGRPLTVVPPQQPVVPPPQEVEQPPEVDQPREVGPPEEIFAEAEPEPASPAIVTQERQAPPVQTTPQTQQQTVTATAATPEIEESGAQGRWRLRRKPSPSPELIESTESPLVQRLKKAALNAAELEALVEELPFLGDLSSMADGLVAEVESQFSAQIASVFVRRQDGYHVIAFRGLSKVESGMVVPETQPLFSDVLQTGEGILIQPVDLAQGLVAGIGGARTEAIMAVPAVVHGACVAVVIAGQDRFTEQDLDRLNDLATEAAPGLAVALALARLRERI